MCEVNYSSYGQLFVDPSIFMIALFADQPHLAGSVLDNNDDREDEDDDRLAANRLKYTMRSIKFEQSQDNWFLVLVSYRYGSRSFEDMLAIATIVD